MGHKHSTMGGSGDGKAPASGDNQQKNKPLKMAAASGGCGGGGVAAAPARSASKQAPSLAVPALSEYTIGNTSNFLGNAEVAALSQTCRLFHQRSQAVLLDRMRPYAQPLLAHVVRGEKVEAKALLTKDPRLLLLINTGDTFDYSGRSIKRLSAWQAALCAGDTDMLAMMQPYFDSIKIQSCNPKGDTIVKAGEQIRLKQTQHIFPKGFEAHLAQQETSTFDFTAIVKAIDEANETQLQSAINLEGAVLPATHAFLKKTNEGVACPLTEKLNAFRQTFTKQSLNEQIFNPQHLLKALEIYSEQCGNWGDNQCRVFWSQVVGFAQRFMPACYAQAFAQGLIYLINEPDSEAEGLRRSFEFRSSVGKIFSDGGGGDLGFKFGAGDWFGQRHAMGGLRAWKVASTFSISKDYFKQKQCTLQTYARICAPDPVSTVVRLGR